MCNIRLFYVGLCGFIDPLSAGYSNVESCVIKRLLLLIASIMCDTTTHCLLYVPRVADVAFI